MFRSITRKNSISGIVFDVSNIIFMVLFSIAVVYPFWQTLVLSFSGGSEVSSLGVHLWPSVWKLDAYRFLLSYSDILLAYYNTIFRTVIGTTLIIFFALMGAYPLSKKDLPFRNTITIFFLITMFFSGGLIPSYLLIKSLGLIDSRWALILPGVVNVFNIIIIRNYLMTIDKAYEESAFIDGANYATVLLKIIIPMAKPVIATIVLWSAVSHWNAWFDCMIYIRNKNKIVMQMVLRQMLEAVNWETNQINTYSADMKQELLLGNVRAATVMISIGPIILLYPFIQKYFIKGISIGSLKG